MHRILYLTVFIGLFAANIQAQQTMGLFQNDSTAFNGYTLFQPLSNTNVYLIDNCGELINQWTTGMTPGASYYLLENGDLLRPCKITNGTFSGGGSGGRIERRDWSGQVQWYYRYSNTQHHQHHDIEMLPNGNILAIAWELVSNANCIAAGRNPAYLGTNLWPDHIVELQPLGVDSAAIVWEWHAKDHLVQDFDSTKANYGVVANSPELINFNYVQGTGTNADWLHINAIDYNPALDQIILSAHSFDEVWIIDHSTTSAEAASHSGGTYGKGGDLLFRWGNPAAYNRGTTNDQKLFGQHDAQWIPDSLPDGGKLMIFNNGSGRPAGNYSSIDIISPSTDLSGNYQFSASNTFLPDTLDWTYENISSFYSFNISGAQRLANGNTLICEGDDGHFFEITPGGQIVWDYINPVRSSGPMTQGNNPTLNTVFRCYRYAPDYPGLSGQNLTPQGPIELNPLPSSCTIVTGEHKISNKEIPVLPELQPQIDGFTVYNPLGWNLRYEVYDLTGKLLQNWQNSEAQYHRQLENLPKGLYIVRLNATQHLFSKSYKIIKL